MSKSDEVSQTSSSAGTSKYVDGVNEENMDAFLKALRSGQYEQTAGRLYRKLTYNTQVGGFCCLGVASELAHQADSIAVRKEEYVYGLVSYNNQELLAPKATIDWLGIPEENVDPDGLDSLAFNIIFFKADEVIDPETLHEHGYEHNVSASELNDDMGLDFDKIADVFENEFKRG